MRLILLLILATGAFLFYRGHNGTISAADWAAPTGQIHTRLLQDPFQQNIAAPRTIPFADGQLTLNASYDITGRVLSRHSYWLDKESKLSPVDLALGWKEMSAYSSISQLSISQSGRFYHYQWDSEGPPIDSTTIAQTSANVHIIPANDDVKHKIMGVHAGQIVHLTGYLVNYYESYSSGRWWAWNSSMTRTDMGPGACEVLYVEHAEIY